jgi:SAM-dependent methyltransferase
MHTQVQGDGTRLPYPDNTFDKIIASEVLEHIPDDVAAYDEFFRILKPGGMLAATVPATFPEKICWKLSDEYYAPKAEGGHVRIYTENEVRSKLEGAGFDPGLSYKAHALHAPYWWIRCAVGVNNEVDDNWTVKQYHKLLEWDIVSQPWITRTAEKLLNPWLGKSLVVQATKSPLRTEKLSQIREAADAST